MSAATQLALTLSCPNRPGIVAAVSGFLFERGGDILEAQQFDHVATSRFFMRILVSFPPGASSVDDLREDFCALAERFSMDWTLRDRQVRKRVLVMVSQFDHCLADLLYRWRIGELPMEFAAIVSNHPKETHGLHNLEGIEYFHLPVARDNKLEQEAKLLEIVESRRIDLVVLARYMQILSDDLAARLAGRCINIHHSFLPGFKGARPYHQAYERGVKLIGATAHFVNAELDEGPIIEQDVERVTHADTPEELVAKGRDIERRVLSRAVRYFLEDRLLLNGPRTVVF